MVRKTQDNCVVRVLVMDMTIVKGRTSASSPLPSRAPLSERASCVACCMTIGDTQMHVHRGTHTQQQRLGRLEIFKVGCLHIKQQHWPRYASACSRLPTLPVPHTSRIEQTNTPHKHIDQQHTYVGGVPLGGQGGPERLHLGR
jgi:hypothetical protein